MSYCLFCSMRDENDIHRKYHDSSYGFPIFDDNELFGRLVLEINQAGLSWSTILSKQDFFRQAFDNFDIYKITNYNQTKIAALMSDKGIVRNQLKINAVIYNANQLLEIRKEFGTFRDWLDLNHPKTIEEWVRLFKKKFKFVGSEIVREFLVSTSYLPGAHDENCNINDKILKSNPKWLE